MQSKSRKMETKISATFVEKRLQESGSESTADYDVYVFDKILDDKRYKLKDYSWIKETKLLKEVSFKQGIRYEILLSDEPSEGYKLPYPIEVSWGKNRVFMKNRNAIFKISENGKEENLSVPVNRMPGSNNFEKGAMRKFVNGELTIDLLRKINALGKFFHIITEGKGYNCRYGINSEENYVLIKKKTLKET